MSPEPFESTAVDVTLHVHKIDLVSRSRSSSRTRSPSAQNSSAYWCNARWACHSTVTALVRPVTSTGRHPMRRSSTSSPTSQQDIGVHLLGRRLYETMLYWETADQDPLLDQSKLQWAAI